jgi:hypothetical protein
MMILPVTTTTIAMNSILNYNSCIAHLFGFGADLFDTEIA